MLLQLLRISFYKALNNNIMFTDFYHLLQGVTARHFGLLDFLDDKVQSLATNKCLLTGA